MLFICTYFRSLFFFFFYFSKFWRSKVEEEILQIHFFYYCFNHKSFLETFQNSFFLLLKIIVSFLLLFLCGYTKDISRALLASDWTRISTIFIRSTLIIGLFERMFKRLGNETSLRKMDFVFLYVFADVT